MQKNQEMFIMVQELHKRFLMTRLLKGLILRLSLQLSSMLEVLIHLKLSYMLKVIQQLGKQLRRG
jgi:hypothetical protein